MTSMPEPPQTVHVCLHGVAQVQREDRPQQALERKQAALLAWLHVEGPTPRSRMATLLWPEADGERGRANLRQRLAKLRALEPALLDDDGRLLALTTHVVVDAGAGAMLAAFDYADCEAFALWLDRHREAAQTDRKAGLARQCRAAIECGELLQAQREAEAMLALDGESEDAHRLLMEVLYLRGAYAEAIVVWDRCRELLRQLFGVPPSPPTQALGDLVLQAARAGRSAPGQQRDAMPLSLLRPPQLIGRSQALDALLAGSYAGQVLCVSGSAGMGKSRLLAEFVSAAGGGVHVAARPGDAVQPYTSLGRLLMAALDRHDASVEGGALLQAARLVPALADRVRGPIEALRTAHEREQALHAVARVLLACCVRPGEPLVLDDLQFADLASVEALHTVLAHAAPALRFAFGNRAGEDSPQGSALLQSLADQGRLTRVVLEPLGQPEVTRLLASLALPGLDAEALAPPLRRRVGGNPAFLLESLKLLMSLGDGALVQPERLPLAPGIDAVVMRRVDLLSAPACQLAQLAAVAGPEFSLALATAVLGSAVPDLAATARELEQRQVMYGRLFVHDLVASAVLQGTAPDTAQRLHRGVAEALESQAADPARVAGHWRACGEWRRAGQASVAAAESARRAERPVERTQWLDAAVDCLDRAGDTDALFDAIDQRLQVAEAPDRASRRVPLMDRLDALARTPPQALRALSQRVGWHTDNGRQESFELGRQGMERAFALGLPDLAFGFLNGVAWQQAMAGDSEAAVQTVERHRAWVLTQPPSTQAEFHLILSGVLGFSDQLLPALTNGEDAIALLRLADRPERTLPVMSNMGLMRWWRGEFDAAKALLLEARLLRDRMHGSGASLIIDLYLGAVLRDRGEFQDAHEVLTATLQQHEREAERQGAGADLTDLVLTRNQLADFWLRIGQPQEALACLMAEDTTGVDLRFRARRAGLLLRTQRAMGHLDAALWTDARAMASAIGSPFNRAWLELELACALPPDEACAEFTRLAQTEPVRQRPGMQLHALLRAAQSASAAGRPADAGPKIVAVQALAERCQPWDIDPAELSLTVGRWHDTQGERTAALRWWRQGAEWLQRCATHRLPAEWRAAFLQRHAVNRALLAAAS